jgi:maleylpyruvate isomerase
MCTPAFAAPGRKPRSLLSDPAAGELTDDVEVADVASVLLEKVEQDTLQRRRLGTVPPVARLADVGKVVGFDERPSPCGLRVQCRYQLFERLIGSNVPAAIPVFGPRIADIAAFEAPLEPSQLVMGKMRMCASASQMTEGDCRGPSLLPGWSRGHVLTHWARNADGQSRMLLAAMRGEVATQYPGGDAQRDRDIGDGAARPAQLILDDVRAATGRLQDVWRDMPPDAWSRSTAARTGPRPAWMSVWARWRETEIHHVDLNAGYTHSQWPAEFVDLLFPRVTPTLAGRLADEITVLAETTDRDPPKTAVTASTAADHVIVRGPASALLCWLIGRPVAAEADLAVSRSGEPWPLPRLHSWV